MVHGIRLASLLDPSTSWQGVNELQSRTGKTAFVHTVTSFEEKAEKARQVCVEEEVNGEKDKVCHCAEGHRCVQKRKDVSEQEDIYTGEPQWEISCPLDKKANQNGEIRRSINSYSEGNPDCQGGKCKCVLNKEPLGKADDASVIGKVEVIRVPTKDGDPVKLLKRYSLPKFSDAYVKAINGSIDAENEKKPPDVEEPRMLEAEEWKKEFPQTAKQLKKIIDHLHKEMTKVEKAEAEEVKDEKEAEAEGLEEEKNQKTSGPSESGEIDGQPAVIETREEKQAGQKAAAGEIKSSVVMEQFSSFQKMCAKLEDNAEELGLADSGEFEFTDEEGKDTSLNCHLDYEEKKVVAKAITDLEKTIEKTPPALSSAPIDAWIAGSFAALAECQRMTQPSCVVNLNNRRGCSSWHRKIEDFIAARPCTASDHKAARLQDLQKFFSS